MKRLFAGLLATAMVLMMCVSVSAEPITDNFNDGILDPAWQVVEQSGGASWDESDGTLNVGGSSGQTGKLVIRYNQTLADVGSVRINYDWISYSDHKARVGLGLFGYDSYWDGISAWPSRGVYIKGVRYRSYGLHAVDGGTGEGIDYHIAYSVPTSGSLIVDFPDSASPKRR